MDVNVGSSNPHIKNHITMQSSYDPVHLQRSSVSLIMAEGSEKLMNLPFMYFAISSKTEAALVNPKNQASILYQEG